MLVEKLVAYVIAGLLEHLSHGTPGLALLLDYLAFGKAPRGLGPETLYKKNVTHGLVYNDGSIRGDGMLEHLPLREYIIYIVRMLH